MTRCFTANHWPGVHTAAFRSFFPSVIFKSVLSKHVAFIKHEGKLRVQPKAGSVHTHILIVAEAPHEAEGIVPSFHTSIVFLFWHLSIMPLLTCGDNYVIPCSKSPPRCVGDVSKIFIQSMNQSVQ